jgi:hypothetical protein
MKEELEFTELKLRAHQASPIKPSWISLEKVKQNHIYGHGTTMPSQIHNALMICTLSKASSISNQSFQVHVLKL